MKHGLFWRLAAAASIAFPTIAEPEMAAAQTAGQCVKSGKIASIAFNQAGVGITGIQFPEPRKGHHKTIVVIGKADNTSFRLRMDIDKALGGLSNIPTGETVTVLARPETVIPKLQSAGTITAPQADAARTCIPR